MWRGDRYLADLSSAETLLGLILGKLVLFAIIGQMKAHATTAGSKVERKNSTRAMYGIILVMSLLSIVVAAWITGVSSLGGH